MRPLLTRREAREFDTRAIEQLQVPGVLLMENAGVGAYQVLERRLGQYTRQPLIVGGIGQNGGDGWVVARQLRAAGGAPRAVVVGDPERVGGDAAVNFAALKGLEIPILVVRASSDMAALQAVLSDATCVVDGLFGTGLDRAVTGLYAEVIEALNRRGAPTLALDIPSGLDANSGAVRGVAVRADCTATFVAPKIGMTQHPARALCGDIEVCGIGVPGPESTPAMWLETRDLLAWLPERAMDAHKGTAGHVVVFAGDRGTTGAALLSGRGAIRSGAGLVTLAPRRRAQAAVDAKVLEMMTVTLPETDVEACLALAERARAVVIGPGFGRDATARRLVSALLRRLKVPTVVDADALTCVAEEGFAMLSEAAAARVLTPHPGEAARLLGVSAADVQADRRAAVLALAEASRQVVVLKGAGTLVAGPQGRLRVCDAGSPAMAVAGMGDVLSGVLASLLCTLSPLEAACGAVYWHASAGARWLCDRGLIASDLADRLPSTLAELRAAAEE